MTLSTRDGRQPCESYTPAASVGPARVVPNAETQSSESRAIAGSAADMLSLVFARFRDAEGMELENTL